MEPITLCLARIQVIVEETDDLTSTVALGIGASVLVIDVRDDILSNCREYDPVTDSLASIHGFPNDHPNSLPGSAWLQTGSCIAQMNALVFILLKKTRMYHRERRLQQLQIPLGKSQPRPSV